MNGLEDDLPPNLQDDSSTMLGDDTEDTVINTSDSNSKDDHSDNSQMIGKNNCIKDASSKTNSEHDDGQNLDMTTKSQVLVVSNLVRPFTLAGLKKMLTKCGKIVDDKFWLNKDKTTCYVCYDDEQIADDSRLYIMNLKWPASNPNTLKCKFTTLQELEDLIEKDKEEKIQLERERKQAAELEAIKQEERKQQLKEDLSRKLVETLAVAGNCSLVECEQTNGDSSSINNNSDQVSNKRDDEKESDRQREVSPPKNPHTNVVHITNLERGFTVKQFKDLLSKNGKLIDEKFWMDKFKSKCYVVYESSDDALKARNYLHGLKWPKTSTKTLKADFGELSVLDELLAGGDLKTDSVNKSDIKQTTNDTKDPERGKLIDKENAKHQTKKEQLSKTVKSNDETSKENMNENNSKPISPPRNAPSNIIFVRGLSRPFTHTQLKDLLTQDGNYDEERFWIDKVKSQCYVVYENDEIAAKTRERLHKLTWPTGNHRKLISDFASEQELKSKLDSNKSTALVKETQDQQKSREAEGRNKDRRNLVDEISNNMREKHDSRQNQDDEMDQEQGEVEAHNSSRRKKDRSVSPNATIKNKREYRMQTNEHHEDNHHAKESPGKTLETLFKKTKTIPSIYWIPLDEDGMRMRDILREKERIERIERVELIAKRKKEAAQEKARKMYNDDHRNGRNRSPPLRRNRSPLHPNPSSRHYRQPTGRNYAPAAQSYRHQVERFRSPPARPMMDRSMRSPDRAPPHHLRTMRTPPMRTPSRSPVRRQRSRSRSASSAKSSDESFRSRRSYQREGDGRTTVRRHSRSPANRHSLKRPKSPPRSPLIKRTHHSRSPIRYRSRSPPRYAPAPRR